MNSKYYGPAGPKEFLRAGPGRAGQKTFLRAGLGRARDGPWTPLVMTVFCLCKIIKNKFVEFRLKLGIIISQTLKFFSQDSRDESPKKLGSIIETPH